MTAPEPESVSPILPASCRNCGEALTGPYCAACGQRRSAPNPTFRELFADAWDALVNVDGRVLASLRLLLGRPGQLTVEYIEGRRARFLPPLRLYLICSVAFFLLEAALPSPDPALKIEREGPAATSLPGAEANAPGPQRRFDRGWKRLAAEPGPFLEKVKQQLPKMIFLLVPLHALLLALVYHRRRRNLPAHLVFALHAHAFLFVSFLLAVIGNATGNRFTDGALDLAAVLWSLYYFPAAMRRAYGGRWWPTLARAVAVGALYATMSGIVIIPYVLAMLWLYGGSA